MWSFSSSFTVKLVMFTNEIEKFDPSCAKMKKQKERGREKGKERTTKAKVHRNNRKGAIGLLMAFIILLLFMCTMQRKNNNRIHIHNTHSTG